MLRAPIALLFAAVSLAHTAAPPPASPQPPAEVDRALRGRIKEFYDLLLNRQYRKAEQLVAPDYRDTYYDRDKPRYMSYELTGITYSADFTRAEVVVTVKLPPISPMNPAPVNTPAASIWRLLDGAWYWSLPKIDVMEIARALAGGKPAADSSGALLPPPIPGGVNLPATLPGGVTLPPGLPENPNLPAGLGRPEAMMGAGEASAPQFTLDPTEVAIKPSTTEKVIIANASSAPMTLFVLGKLPGIEAALDRTLIQPGEKTVLAIHAAAEATGGALLIGITSTRAMIKLPVTVR
jgi:hypothetical protein